MRGKTTPKTPELNNKIIKLYNDGMSGEKIATELHVATKYVRMILKDFDPNYGKPKMRQLNNNEVIVKFKELGSIKKVASFFRVDPNRIREILVQNNIKFKCAKHNLNGHIFDCIDTEEKAYWLGFIYADGYISDEDKHHIEINLKASDWAHLEKFNTFIGGDKDIVRAKTSKIGDKTYPQVDWSITDRDLWLGLYRCGIRPRKSLTLVFPDDSVLPDMYKAAFIRGYFDGDGSISTIETSHVKLYTTMIGTKSFLESISKWMNSPNHITEFNTGKNIVYYLKYKIAFSIKFLQKIYKNPKVYLERKYNLWINYCRSNAKVLEELQSKFGEGWDVTSEVIRYLNYNGHCNA